MLRLLPRDSERNGAPARATQTGKIWVATAGTAHHSRAPKKRGLSLVQCPLVVRGSTTTSAAQRARGKLAYCAFFRETASEVARSRVPRESRLLLGGRSWHVAPRPRTYGRKDSRRRSGLA